MTSDATAESKRVERWDALWSLLPLVAVGLPAVIAQTNGFQPWALVLSAATALWYWWMVLRHDEWTALLRPMLLYYGGLLLLSGVLVRLDDAFLITAIGTFFQAFMLLPDRWPYAAVALSTGLLWLNTSWSELSLSQLPNLLLTLGLTLAIGGSIRAVHLQNDRRREIIAELEQTSRELAELAEENAGLQSQLVTQARESGVHTERQRMAREIHDTLAQGLIGIITHLEVADQHLRRDPEQAAARVRTAQDLARASLTEARRSVRALRPAPLAGDAALPDALRKVTDSWSAAHGVSATLTVTGDARPLHPEVEITLLRVAQEALANTAKHAGADRAGITLSYMEDVVALDIRDNGAGFDAARQRRRPPDAQGGFGLTSMRQRVHRLAGTLAVESAPGAGTGLSATVPAIAQAAPATRGEQTTV